LCCTKVSSSYLQLHKSSANQKVGLVNVYVISSITPANLDCFGGLIKAQLVLVQCQVNGGHVVVTRHVGWVQFCGFTEMIQSRAEIFILVCHFPLRFFNTNLASRESSISLNKLN
jgi:hypothetical protein